MKMLQRATLIAVLGLAAALPLRAASTIILQNNHPFPWRLPVRARLDATHDVWVIADLPASGTQQITPGAKPAPPRDPLLRIDSESQGARLVYSGKDLGLLTWNIETHPVTPGSPETNSLTNFDASFQPLPLEFRKQSHTRVVDAWRARATNNGLVLQIDLDVFAAGFLDINAHLTNTSADPAARVYAAVVCRWQRPLTVSGTLCYDNHIRELASRDQSPFRAGTGRQQFVQRGVDWTRAEFRDGATVAWLNDFAPSFTVLDNSTNNPLHAPRYAGANLSQLGQEIQLSPGRFLVITEIARPGGKTFADRVTENVLPARGEGVSFSSRLIFTNASFSPGAIDNDFVAFTSYNEQSETPAATTISFGVPSVRFGTSYFPYSTLGENFDELKLPGMDRESFWPLAADTVLQWRLFADDIRRDLRIAKAMGFQLIRLHHLELLAAIPPDTRREYLDFLFDELKRLKLRALVDVYASPEQLAGLVGRYRDVIDGVELENEILIWGIPLDRPAQWNAEYDAVHNAAPDIPVNLTGFNNTGMFERLRQLGVKFDRVDLHSYIDSLDAIPSGRGYALALGSYASKIGKPPMISEWNWRGLTKMSESNRAEIYRPIMENVLATRAIPDFYEFQFNETLAPNPRLGRGNLLRHYELLNLSRRPKLEAFELMKLIEQYSAPEDPVRVIESSHEAVDADARGAAKLSLSITNLTATALHLRASVETSAGVEASLSLASPLTLPASGEAIIPIDAHLTNDAPGFYHVFLRLESDSGLLRYLWAEVRRPGTPKMDAAPASEQEFDFSQPITVAYGPKATVLEVETAFAIGQTLESATGRVVPILPLSDVPDAAQARLIFVGAEKELPARGRDWLLVTGKNTRETEQAGMNLILRYWKYAKDSAARRVGLARKDLPRGGDAVKLP